MATRSDVKETIAKEVRALVDRHCKEKDPRKGQCAFLAAATMKVTREYGIPCMIQAGTAFWPRMEYGRAQANPMEYFQFGFQWEDNTPRIKLALELGILPEMHVWNFLPYTDELVDFSTRDWPRLCKAILNQGWEYDPPPDFLWTGEKAYIPLQMKGVKYKAEYNAIGFIRSLMLRMDNPLIKEVVSFMV